MKKNQVSLRKFILVLLIFSIIAFIYSYFARNKLPDQNDILSSLNQEPEQVETTQDPFQIQKEDILYHITPKFSYEQYGLVVADYDSESWYDFAHKNDPLNTKDLCIVWGTNIQNDVYQQMKYSHGEWTCYAEFKTEIDSSWYEKFSGSHLANNHLLPADDVIYEKIKNSHIGDQVYIKGLLVDYSIETSEGRTGLRKTSTIRDDTDCEIIYTTEFEVLREGNSTLYLINAISKYSIIILAILFIILFFA
jgi:hypothetical protein